MLEVADYLAASGFQVWVVSGTDRFIVRGIVSGSPLAVPPERIIGSDKAVVATGQNGARTATPPRRRGCAPSARRTVGFRSR